MSRSPPKASWTSMRSSSPGLDPERRRVRRVEVEDGVLGRQPLHGRVPARGFDPELRPHEGGALPERLELPARHVAGKRRHAAVGARQEARGRHVLQDAPDRAGHLLRRLDAMAGHVDHPRQDVLPLEQPQQLQRHARRRALDGDLTDPAPRQQRERPLVLPPLTAERGLPVDVGLDPVAVADVDSGVAPDPLDRPLERRDAPVLDVAHVGVDVERRLVELDRVDPERRQLPRLGVERGRDVEREPRPVPVVRVRHRVDDGHRPRQRPLEPPRGAGPREGRLGGVNGRRPPDRTHHRRHVGDVAVPPDADARAARRVDALEPLGEAVDEVTARLLPVRHHVDPGLLLVSQREDHRVPLALEKRLRREPPRRPQRLRRRQPRRLGQAARDGRRQHARSTCSSGRRCGASRSRRRAPTPRASARRARRARTSRDDPALQRLVDGRRDGARMPGQGAPALGLGEERVAVGGLPGRGLSGRGGLGGAELPRRGRAPPAGSTEDCRTRSRGIPRRRPPPGRPGSAWPARSCRRTSRPRSSGARSPASGARRAPRPEARATTCLASSGLLFSMLRMAEIGFWMIEAWPHTKARLFEAASHMNTSGIMDSR